MSYTDDCMKSLTYALRETKELVIQLKEFNKNKEILNRIADALERQNELKEIELGISKTHK